MDRDQLAEDLRIYLVEEIHVIRDPQDRQQILRDFSGTSHRNIEDVAEVFTRTLVHEGYHPLLAGLADDILSAFHDFRTAPGGDKQQLRQCADCLAIRLEPFWKQVLYLAKGEEPCEDGPGAKKLLQSVLPHSWREGNPVDRFITFAREWRHTTAHNAPDVSEVDLRLYLEAAFGVYLLVVEENYETLADIVLGDVQRALRDQFGLGRYLDRLANPPRLTEYYVPSIGKLGGMNGDFDSLAELFDRFLLDEASRVLLLVGGAGSGKSTFLRWKLADIAKEELARLARERRLYRIPIYYPLRNLQCTEVARLDQTLLRHLAGVGRWRLSQATPEELFGAKGVSWVISLDGLDELRDWNLGIQIIEEFVDKFAETGPLVKVVLASRPEVLDDSWGDRFPVLRIESWSEVEIQEYAQRRTPGLTIPFLAWLNGGQLLDLVRIPLLLEKVTDRWLQSHIEIEEAVVSCELLKLSIRATLGEQRNGELLEDQLQDQAELISEEIRQQVEQYLPKLEEVGLSDSLVLTAEQIQEQLEQYLLRLVPPVQAIDYAIRGLLEHQLAKLSGPERHRKVDGLLAALQKLAFELDGRPHLEAHQARQLVGDDLDDLIRMSLITHYRQEIRFGHDLVKLCLAAKEFGYRLPKDVETLQHLNDFLSKLHGRLEFWQQCFAVAPQVLSSEVPYPVWLLPQFSQQQGGVQNDGAAIPT